ncbi:hypothetical protein [Nocardia sp. NPDC052112]|uniref:hypothetical protein n=1 Tax=Nocardia sp. NPDC052112 TaxID=3155646 RepID=UPI00341726A5
MTTPNRAIATAMVASTAVFGIAAVTGCGDDSTDTSTLVQQPPVEVHGSPTRLGWTSFQGMQLPVADQGPKSVNGAVARGFDHTPVGAGLAAIHASVRISVATDIQWALVAQQMLAPGPGRDAWALARAQISITSAISTGAPTVLGYLISRYSTQAADIAIYTRQADASLTRNTVTVLWQSGDWRLLLLAQPTVPTVAAVDTTPADMVALPGH